MILEQDQFINQLLINIIIISAYSNIPGTNNQDINKKLYYVHIGMYGYASG